ncbi:MAG: YicC/YloC family endoribonuclease [Phycisphaeraceae bacterium]
MTGFGDASCETAGVHYAVELRSLNNRYFKGTIRLPDLISGLEAELDSLLRKRISRGSLTLTIGIYDRSAAAAYQINPAAIKHYSEQLQAIPNASVELGSLLALPGVMQPPEAGEYLEKARPIVVKLVEQACDKMAAMRQTEGETLAGELGRHNQFILERIEQIAARAPQVTEEYHQRLRARIDDLMARAKLQFSEVDLVKEVALYAERCDIAEECQRVKAHLDQFTQIVHRNDGEPAGRTLDFLAQELLREANTIASKSNDAQISRIIVEVKGTIDRIKEQVQNVE